MASGRGKVAAMISRRSSVLLLVCLVVVWGANWPIMKIGLAHITPLWFAVLRLGLGSACILGLLAATGRLAVPSRADLPVVFSVGLLQMAVFMALVNLALLVVPAGRSAILAYTTPLWVAPGAALLLGERLNAGRLAGLGLGLAGVAVLFNPAALDWSNGRVLAGNGLLLLAALAWAATILHVRGHRWIATPLQLAPWQMLVGLVPLSVLALALEGPPHADGSAQFWWVAIYNGPLATALAFWIAVTVTRALPAVTVSLAFLTVPAFGLVASVLSLGERLDAATLAGLALICAGVATVALVGSKHD
jgi:drug/metabolite transporter (DMT)-like permease